MFKAPRRGVPFRLYVAAEDKIIVAVLTQETEDKEYVITYISRRLIDAGTRSMRGQIIADFIVEHRINDKYDLKVGYVTCTPRNYISIDRFVMMIKELVLS